MNKEMILGLVRHALTFLGGFFVLKGWVSEAISQEVIGGVMSLVGTLWSVFSKKEIKE